MVGLLQCKLTLDETKLPALMGGDFATATTFLLIAFSFW
jgi:hypothetical protein